MHKIIGSIYGFCVGDALGVPAEFNSREALRINPIETMQAADGLNLPAGTWSDDTSMMLATMESLAEGLDYEDMMVRFYRWFNFGDYTAAGKCFDIGNTTRKALLAFAKGKPALECGRDGENDNGNGSLMRILPLAFYLQYIPDEEERMQIIHNCASLTHAHKRGHIACSIYIFICMALFAGKEKKEAALLAIRKAFRYYKALPEYKDELCHYAALEDIDAFIAREDSDISSSGYVVDTLEAAIWCFYTTHSYKACVLRAVNLGDDADTIAALAGGIAGVYYGAEAIPADWMEVLQGKEMLENIYQKFYRCLRKKARQLAEEE